MTSGNLSVKVDEERGLDRSITRLPAARTAFVGRTLRGPVNRPILIKSFLEFQHVFGGLWQPSLLGYAVEHFFDNGGREALIVRVVNGARSATLTLAAGSQTLKLQAVRPGTREFLRASVDYDNIAPDAVSLFNLTVQRVRAQGTGQVEDQEIFHRLSIAPTAETYLPTCLAASALIRVRGEVPTQRPDRTLDPASGLASAYVTLNSDGDDGAPLTDYDLIGSSTERTGLFALFHADYFNFLCIPPVSRDRDVGPSALLVAARYCKERRALLIVDPPASWHTADDALAGLRNWNLSSENALMYFPRVLAHDKLRGHFESFAPCGAVAGMLARHDEMFPVWAPAEHEEAVLRPGYRPACLVSGDRRVKLANLGVNTLHAIRSSSRIGVPARTLAAASAATRDWQYLRARRLALFIVNSIERGTRWVTEVESSSQIAESVAAQVRAFFAGLCESGTFGTRRMEDAFFVICDPAINSWAAGRGEFQLAIGFAANRDHGLHRFRISHSPLAGLKPGGQAPLQFVGQRS
ncbi:MAG: phage tail sheath family protein [Steroidobacteraceae bacterium]